LRGEAMGSVDLINPTWVSLSKRMKTLVMWLQTWMLLLRYFVGVMTWLTVIIINIALLGFTLFCFTKSGNLGTYAVGKVGSCC
jgi:hypothetical protein